MPKRTSHKAGSELFIVDNSDEEWKCLRYLHDWCQISQSIDIASGYFEIGALRALDGEWQRVDKIRILMGDEVSHSTKAAFQRAVQKLLSPNCRHVDCGNRPIKQCRGTELGSLHKVDFGRSAAAMGSIGIAEFSTCTTLLRH